MTTVNLSGTWSEKTKPNNGLTKVAELINGNRTIRIPVVGWVEFHQWTEKATGNLLTVAMPVVESVLDADGADSHGWGEAVMEMIDALRKERGLSAADDVPTHAAQLAGQMGFDFDGLDEGGEGGSRETRLGPDGEHRVPEASAEELEAERREAAEAGVPAATFSGDAA